MTLHDSIPAVSIVVPCYNGGAYLDRLLACLASQTFRDFEIVIVDDGSTDEATRGKLASLDPGIRVIHQANRGLSGARNTGFREALAPIVLTLDCDDTIEPTCLETLMERMSRAAPSVAMVFSDMKLAGAVNSVVKRSFNPFDLLFSNTLPSGLLIRKEAWHAVGGFDETMRDGYEDWEFFLRLSLAGYGALGVPEPLYVYRVSPDGMLFGRSSRLHSALWRRIREKHEAAYRLPAILRLWWRTRDGSGQVSLMRGLAQYALARLLPDAWFSGLIGILRRRRLLGPGMAHAKAAKI